MRDRDIDLIRRFTMLVSKRTYMYAEIEKCQNRINECGKELETLRGKIMDTEAELMEFEKGE